MSSAGIRAYHLAQELAKVHDVTLLGPEADEDRGVVGVESWRPLALARRLAGFDAIVTRQLPGEALRRLAGRTRLVFDLSVPALPEALATGWSAHGHAAAVAQTAALATGDAFVCAGERQRDYLLGMLAALRRLDPATYRRDPSFRSLVGVVPYGVSDDPPRHDRAVLRGVVPGIGESDQVLLWGGGLAEWFDPETVVRAVAGGDARLVFLGVPPSRLGNAAERALTVARDLGVLNTNVFALPGWVPYAERAAYLCEADLGVSAHLDTLETRLSFRTRLLDYFWAGLPTVTTSGDELGELIERHRVGRTVAPGDVDGWRDAIRALVEDRDERARIRERLALVRLELAWPRVVQPLLRLLEPAPAPPRAPLGRLRLDELRLRARLTLQRRGWIGGAAPDP